MTSKTISHIQSTFIYEACRKALRIGFSKSTLRQAFQAGYTIVRVDDAVVYWSNGVDCFSDHV